MKHFLLLLRFKVGSIILERFIYLFIEIWLKKSSLEIFSNRLIESRVLIHVDISKLEFSLNYRLYRSRQEENIHVSKRALSTKDSRLRMRKEKRRKKKETRSNDKEEDRVAPRKNYRGERLASNTGVCQSGEEWESSPREDGRMKERGGRGREKFEKCTAPFFIIRLPSSISEGGKRVSTLPRNPWPAPSLFTILTNPLLLMALPWLCRLMAARSINRNSIPALRGPRRSNE